MTTEINAALDERIASGSLPGVVVQAIDRKGHTIHSHASGKLESESGDDAKSDTVFWIASCTKAITATACMQLVEQGKLTLDEPVDKFIPELTSKAKILTGYDEHGEPKLQAPKNKITLRHLLTHTAGLGYTFYNQKILRFAEQRGDHLEWRFKKQDFDTPLLFEPGTAWNYGLNLDWAGQIVESISNLSLEEYFQKYIFKPCGMKDTTFCIHARPDMLKRLAKSRHRQSDGTLEPREAPYSVDEPEAHHGGAGLFSTVQDYCSFISIFLGDGVCPTTGERVLKKETVDLMNQSAIKEELTGTTLDSPIDTVNERLSTSIPNLLPGARKQWGLSFLLLPDSFGSRGAESFQWAGIENCWWWVDRKSGVAGVTFNQILPFGDVEVAQMWAEWEAGVYKLHEAKAK